jgi:anthranilate synthase/aminodeoxychorismate synthase-like glutamine amidotransferase
MYLLIDNYDSFTHILHHYLLLTGNACAVYKNDELSVDDIIKLNPDRIIISPGPETPLQAGVSLEVVAHFHQKVPILGVCLGHQALGMYFGAHLVHVPPMHGKTSAIAPTHHPLFRGLPNPFTAMRYHSLAITDVENTQLEVIATADDGVIMALAHQLWPCIGVQFHPESIGTPDGLQLLRNWAALPF